MLVGVFIRSGTDTRDTCTQRKDHVRTAIFKSEREVSEETEPADTLILDFQSPKLSENKVLLLKLPSL